MTAFTLVNSAEGILPAGATLTGGSGGNTGGASGNFFDAIQLGSSSACVSDNSTADTGSLCVHMSTPAVADNVFAAWRQSLPGGGIGGTGQAQLYSRVSIRLPSYPSGNWDLILARDTGAAECSHLYLDSTGRVNATDANDVTVVSMVTQIPLNQWVRVEYDVTAASSGGAVTVRIYLNSRATTPDEVKSAAGLNTQGPVCLWDMGPAINVPRASASIRYDNFGVTSTGPMGPAGPPAPATGGGTSMMKRSMLWADL